MEYLDKIVAHVPKNITMIDWIGSIYCFFFNQDILSRRFSPKTLFPLFFAKNFRICITQARTRPPPARTCFFLLALDNNACPWGGVRCILFGKHAFFFRPQQAKKNFKVLIPVAIGHLDDIFFQAAAGEKNF